MRQQIPNKDKFFFILNGPDLEMDEVVKVLKKENIDYIMPYMKRSMKIIKAKDLKKYKKDKRTRVYIECFPEKRAARKSDIYIDHHSEFIARRAALIQVKKLFKFEVTQNDLWIEAFDRAGVWGALKIGAPKKTVNQWIEHELKRDFTQQCRKYWLDVIKKSPTVNGIKVVRMCTKKDIVNPRTTSLIHIYDYTNYPKKKNLLIVITCKNQVLKYYFFSDPKISRKLYKKFGGYIFGNPKLNNISWAINQKWPIPKEDEVWGVVTGK